MKGTSARNHNLWCQHSSHARHYKKIKAVANDNVDIKKSKRSERRKRKPGDILRRARSELMSKLAQ